MRKAFVMKRRKKSTSFNPNKEFVDKAIKDYLQKGGKITKDAELSDEYEELVTVPDARSSADEFLMNR